MSVAQRDDMPSGQPLKQEVVVLSDGLYVRVSLGGENTLYVRKGDYDRFSVAVTEFAKVFKPQDPTEKIDLGHYP